MRLCHIVPSLAEQHGGPSKSVRGLCAALAANGDQVDLLTTEVGAPVRADWHTAGRLRTATFGRDWPQRFCPSAGLRRAVLAADAQLVHHHSLWLRTLHYAHLRAKRGAKFVLSPRGMMGGWAWRHRRARKRIADCLVHPGALAAVDGWHATSVEEADDIRRLGFRQPIGVAANGVAAPTPDSTAAARAFWTERWPAIASRPVAVFFSRFHQKKRVLELIELWAESAPREWLLLLAGIPQDYTPEQLDAYATKLSAGDRISAFAGIGLPPPYAVASLFVLPSHNENFGLAIAEAMAHGVPALVTDTTPWSALNAAELGWCVPWQEYGRALRAATTEEPARLAARGSRARDWVLREYSWERAAHTMAEFYRSLV